MQGPDRVHGLRRVACAALAAVAAASAALWSGPPARSAGTPVVILATIPLTGDAASYGEIQKRGYEIALAEVNGSPGAPLVKIVYRDTQLKPKDAVDALRQGLLVDKPQVVFSISTAEVMAQAPIANANNVVLLSPLASGDDLSHAGPYVYRVSPSDSFQGKVMAENILKLGVRDVAVLYVNSAWGVGLSSRFRDSFERGGGRVVLAEAVDPNQRDFRTSLEKVRAAKPAGLFLILNPGNLVAALRQIRELGIDARLFGADTFSDQTVYTAAKNEAQGVIFSLPAKPDSPAFKSFDARYRAKFNAPADINAAAAYDSVLLVARAVRTGATTGEAIKRYFNSQPPMEGASGRIVWDDNHDIISKAYATYRIDGDSYKPFIQ